MVKKISVTVTGSCPYMQHRNIDDKAGMEELKKIVKTLQKDPSNEEAYTKEAEMSTYRNAEGYYIPSSQIETCLTKAGANEQVQGKGKKTYKDYMNAFVVVEPEEIPITPQKYVLDRHYVKVQRARVMRTRPKFDKGWKASFSLMVLDDTISTEILRNILMYAGGYIGIGDWRPKYGRFEVTEFTEQ
jgi:hypothetical protein